MQILIKLKKKDIIPNKRGAQWILKKLFYDHRILKKVLSNSDKSGTKYIGVWFKKMLKL